MSKILPRYTKDWLEAEYARGKSVTVLAYEMGVSPPTLLKHFKEIGIPLRSQAAENKRKAPAHLRETLHSKDWVDDQLKKGLSANKIAGMLGCSVVSVTRHVKNHGLELKQRGHKNLKDPVWMRRHYMEKCWSAKRIAEHLGVYASTVIDNLKLLGFPVRGHKERRVPIDRASKPVLMRKAYEACPEAPCRLCGKKPANVHHKNHNLKEVTTKNLERLCMSCHGKQHRYEDRIAGEMLKALLEIKTDEVVQLRAPFPVLKEHFDFDCKLIYIKARLLLIDELIQKKGNPPANKLLAYEEKLKGWLDRRK